MFRLKVELIQQILTTFGNVLVVLMGIWLVYAFLLGSILLLRDGIRKLISKIPHK